MTDRYFSIVWINHTEAKLYRFHGNAALEAEPGSPTSLQRVHHPRPKWETGPAASEDPQFYNRIKNALGLSERTVITGPGNTKSALKRFLDYVQPDFPPRVLVVETFGDAPSPETLLELRRRYFPHKSQSGAAPT